MSETASRLSGAQPQSRFVVADESGSGIRSRSGAWHPGSGNLEISFPGLRLSTPDSAPGPDPDPPRIARPWTHQPEVWLRGPVSGIPAEFLPAAHAFLQTMEDVERAAGDLSLDQSLADAWRCCVCRISHPPSVGQHGSSADVRSWRAAVGRSKAALSAEDSTASASGVGADRTVAQHNRRSARAPSRSAGGISLRVPDGRSRGAPNHDHRSSCSTPPNIRSGMRARL